MGMFRRPTFKLPTAAQAVVVGSLCSFVIWGIIITALFLLVTKRYTGVVVDVAQERYASSGAERVGAQAGQILESAHIAFNAIDYAVQRGLYVEPLDYDALRMALEPAFAANPKLRAVDLAFDTRNDSITVRRMVPGASTGSFVLLVQSDAKDCLEQLGRFGCLSGKPPRSTDWFQLGIRLPGGQEVDNASDTTSSRGPRFLWSPAPGFVPNEQKAILKGGMVVAWDPSYSLIFRSVFPGTRGMVSVVGRAVVEVGGLRADELLDDKARVGEKGAVYICDHLGTVLASLPAGSQALIQRPSGVVRFRLAWELPGPWAELIQPQHFLGLKGVSMTTPEGFNINIEPLRGVGMGHFSVLVIAQRTSFTDSAMIALCSLTELVVVLPYPVVFANVLGCLALFHWQRRKKVRKVGPAPISDDVPPLGESSGFSALASLRSKQLVKPAGDQLMLGPT